MLVALQTGATSWQLCDGWRHPYSSLTLIRRWKPRNADLTDCTSRVAVPSVRGWAQVGVVRPNCVEKYFGTPQRYLRNHTTFGRQTELVNFTDSGFDWFASTCFE